MWFRLSSWSETSLQNIEQDERKYVIIVIIILDSVPTWYSLGWLTATTLYDKGNNTYVDKSPTCVY